MQIKLIAAAEVLIAGLLMAASFYKLALIVALMAIGVGLIAVAEAINPE